MFNKLWNLLIAALCISGATYCLQKEKAFKLPPAAQTFQEWLSMDTPAIEDQWEEVTVAQATPLLDTISSAAESEQKNKELQTFIEQLVDALHNGTKQQEFITTLKKVLRHQGTLKEQQIESITAAMQTYMAERYKIIAEEQDKPFRLNSPYQRAEEKLRKTWHRERKPFIALLDELLAELPSAMRKTITDNKSIADKMSQFK